MLADESIALCGFEIRSDHLFDKLIEGGARRPAEFALGLGRVAQQSFNLGGAEIAGVYGYDYVSLLVRGLLVYAASLPGQVQLEQFGAALDELADAILLASGYDEVLRLLLLEHEPLHLDVVAGVAPVAFRVEVAEEELSLQTHLDAGETASDLAGDEGLAAQG